MTPAIIGLDTETAILIAIIRGCKKIDLRITGNWFGIFFWLFSLVVMVTHNESASLYASRTLHMLDGAIEQKIERVP